MYSRGEWVALSDHVYSRGEWVALSDHVYSRGEWVTASRGEVTMCTLEGNGLR